ncbi:Nidogen-1 [Labeo rohita]|uniref:Nidogen-1 n=1 Tax=Labeo rohita TaxID=84645 RepID=A0ABQ8M7S3_LABRO|nr:Nidogen-1 [Labeo rohita]
MVLLRSVGLLALLVSVQCLNREQLFDYGIEFGDKILESGTDSVKELELEQTLLFFKGKFDKIYVNTNGFISVTEPTDESEYLGKMPASFGMIAAFLGDLDTTDGAGHVYFRQDKSPEVLRRAAEHISQAFPSDDGIEPTHAIIVTWENVLPQGEHGRGDGYEFSTASYAILLYPEEKMQFGSTLIDDQDQPVEVGFNEGKVAGWFGWATTQGSYYRITQDEESVSALAQETNSGRPGIWVYQIGKLFFTSIIPGEVTQVTESTEGTKVTEGTEVMKVTEVTDFTTEETMVDTPAPEPSIPWIGHHKELQTFEPPYETLTTSPEPFAESSTPDEPQYHYVQPRRPQTPLQQQPQIPQVVIIDEDELNVDVFSYNYETCSSNKHKCSVFADCRDYANGYCCHCKPGYYGNGKDCVAEGKPQRMNGKVNGRIYVGDAPSPVEFSNNDLHSYVVTNDGRAYIAISSIPSSVGPSLQPLPALGEAIGWAFALEQPDYQNGFSIVVITSSSRRDYTVNMPDGSVRTYSYLWTQNIKFQSCSHEEVMSAVPASQQLSVDQIFVMYDASNQLIRFAMSNKIGSIHSGIPEQNPCFTGRHGCDTNAACRPAQGKEFTCECAAGFTGDGRVCYDVDECSESPQICGPYSICNNQPGSFRCECLDGFRFASDGRTCVGKSLCFGDAHTCNKTASKQRLSVLLVPRAETERPVDHCQRGTHDCDAPERARCSYTGDSSYVCSCLPGFSGDGRACQDIDECQPGRCHSDAICYNTQGSFTCQCRPGFHGDGFSCTPGSDREQTACERHRESALGSSGGYFSFRPRPAVGQHVPTCDAYGAYEPTQCHASVGIDHNVAPPLTGPTPRTDISPLTPGANLLFAQNGKIDHIPLDGNRMNKDESKTVLHVPGKVVIAVAFDCVEQMIYWSDITQPAISRAKLQGGETSILISKDLGSPEGIAVDHMSRNMYWTDSILDRIEVSRLDGSQRRVLFDNDLINPRPIVADPANGYLYWADWNRDGPKIERSSMDGSDRTALVQDGLGLPNALTFDPQSRQLCWADAGTRKVECVDPFSRLRRKLTEGIQYPFAIVEAVVALDRNDGMEVEEFLPQRRSRTYGITMTYPQCPAGVNYCSRDNGGCSHLCLPRPGGFTCRCPSATDGSCVEQDENF